LPARKSCHEYCRRRRHTKLCSRRAGQKTRATVHTLGQITTHPPPISSNDELIECWWRAAHASLCRGAGCRTAACRVRPPPPYPPSAPPPSPPAIGCAAAGACLLPGKAAEEKLPALSRARRPFAPCLFLLCRQSFFLFATAQSHHFTRKTKTTGTGHFPGF
jgi:hypothetical protein